MITLPYAGGAEFCPEALVGYFAVNRLPYLKIGGENVSYDKLKHEVSLDRWLRSLVVVTGNKKNTRQAVVVVVAALCDTGYFERFTLPPNGIKGKDPDALRCTVLPDYDQA